MNLERSIVSAVERGHSAVLSYPWSLWLAVIR